MADTKKKQKPAPRTLDTQGVVALFGGRSRLLYLLRDHGFISADPRDPDLEVFSRQLTVKAIDKWKERGTIPGHWLQALMQLHQTVFGTALPLEDFRLSPLSHDNRYSGRYKNQRRIVGNQLAAATRALEKEKSVTGGLDS